MNPFETPERAAPWRRRLVLAGWLVAAAVICARAVQIQVVQGPAWRVMAEDQHTTDRVVVAPRGTVLDRDGTPLVVSREIFRVAVAPAEVQDPDAAVVALAEALDLSPRRARAFVDPSDPWHVVPGRYPPSVREALAGIRGVHLERELQRYHPHGDLARGVLGVIIDDEGAGGIEQAYEEHLRGTSGRSVVARDNVGRPIPGETFEVEAPRAGGEVVLTLDMDLQEITRQALEEAIAQSEARGGDALVTNPFTGEILSLVSIRDGRTASLSAINTPFEPGSTLKPFTVAGLLSRDLAHLSDTVDVENGTWRVAGRTLHDVAAEGRLTIADALRVSSNVGIAKAARALTPGHQYENLRDFGFGVPTGIEIPGEVGGTLRRPDRWSGQSPASLAIGYELSVTPLQMAMAYGALANGGTLMEPRLVREIRDPSGQSMERFPSRAVRRVVEPGVARMLGRVLEDVVSAGSGTRASLGSFRVAGKSGTSRAYSPDGGYRLGDYYSSFVGFFPAEDPQLVVFVKLERPRKGAYYGGSVAAPVTRATMEAALASRATPLDRGRLLPSVQGSTRATAPATARFASRRADPPAPPIFPDEIGMPGLSVEDRTRLRASVPIPEVAGLPMRTAARRLHGLGLRVVQEGRGEVVGTEPAQGARVLPGDTVRLRLGHRESGGRGDG